MATAAELTITSLDDSGPGTLRDYLLSSQDGDIFLFQPGLSGTLQLQSPLPDISSNIMIQGLEDHRIVIDGASQYSIFHFTEGQSAISRLDLQNGAPALGGIVQLESDVIVFLDAVHIVPQSSNTEGEVYVKEAAELRIQRSPMSTETIMGHVVCHDGSSLVWEGENSVRLQIESLGTTVFQKKGVGTVELRMGAPTDIQPVVEGGVLVFNGTTSQPIYVQVPGQLRGNLSCLSIVNDGTVRPGNSIGIMSMTGDYNQTTTGVLQIELSPTGMADLIQVGSNAFLDGKIELMPELGLYLKGDSFTFLTAGGVVAGTFSLLEGAEDGFRSALSYFPQAVQLTLLQNTVSFFGGSLTGNPKEVLTTLENATVSRGSDLFSVLSAINALSSSASVKEALTQLGPTPFASIAWSDATTLYQLAGMVTQPPFGFCDVPCAPFKKPCCPQSKPNRIWLQAIGEKTEQSTVDSLFGFQTWTEGALLGYNAQGINHPWTLGGYVGYTHSHLTWHEIEGKTNTNSEYASVYTSVCWPHFQLDASILGSFYQYDISRTINFPGVDRKAKSSPSGGGLLGHVGATGFVSSNVPLFPFGKVDVMGIWQGSFKEKGAQSLDLNVSSAEFTFLHAEAGALVEKPFCFFWGSLVPACALSWVYFGPLSGTNIKGQLASVPTTMVMRTSSHGFNGVSPMLSLGFMSGERWWVSLAYKGEFSDHRTEQDINLQVKVQF